MLAMTQDQNDTASILRHCDRELLNPAVVLFYQCSFIFTQDNSQ